MRKVKLYNNLGRKKVEFRPQIEGEVKFYSCGPTTYDFVHVGNARAFVTGDLIHRIFKTLGYKVTFVRNYTDVDDKIINKAKERGIDPIVHAAEFVKECEKDMNSLGMLPATHTPKVSETIPEIIEMVSALVEKKNAYVVGSDVWYEVPTFSEYGKLSKKDLEQLSHGIRVDVNDEKRNPQDFALWKSAKPGEPSWDSPWGKGRPGWHIECSAMSRKFLGDTIDIHHGGVDLIFPHHENEIAQSEAANGHTYCNHWCHNEFLNFGSEKMSKSLGNVVTIRKFVEIFGGEILRQILASVHYRSRQEWNDETIKRGIADVERIHKTLSLYQKAKVTRKDGATNEAHILEVKEIKEQIESDLANDFNVPSALSHFFLLVRLLNRDYLDEQGNYEGKQLLSNELITLINETITFFQAATGLIHNDADAVLAKVEVAKVALSPKDRLAGDDVEKLLIERKEARATKNWKRSDEIRDLLAKSEIVVKDNPDGTTTWSYK